MSVLQTDGQTDRQTISHGNIAGVKLKKRIDRSLKNGHILWLRLRSRQQEPAAPFLFPTRELHLAFTTCVFELTTDQGLIRARDYGEHERTSSQWNAGINKCISLMIVRCASLLLACKELTRSLASLIKRCAHRLLSPLLRIVRDKYVDLPLINTQGYSCRYGADVDTDTKVQY